MINLLPTETKKQIRAARLNVILLRYCALLAAALLFTLTSFGVGVFITLQTKTTADAEKATAATASAQFSAVKSQAEAFASNLNAAKAILGNQISYSTTLIKITNSLPPGTVLNNLSLSDASFITPLTLSARATSSATALGLKTALADSKLFGSVNIVSITVNPSSDNVPTQYPIQVSISATLSKAATVEDKK